MELLWQPASGVRGVANDAAKAPALDGKPRLVSEGGDEWIPAGRGLEHVLGDDRELVHVRATGPQEPLLELVVADLLLRGLLSALHFRLGPPRWRRPDLKP